VSLQLFREQVAPGHSLSRPVAGSGDSLAGITREEVLETYDRLFAPRNLILALRGGGSGEALLRRASEIFGGPGPGGGWSPSGPASTQVEPTALLAPPPPTSGAARSERVVGKRQSYLRLGAVVEVAPEDRPALAVASLILSDRLQMDLRETRGLAYSIGASLTTLGHGRGLIAVSMGTAADNLERSETEIRRLVAELGDSISREELDRVVAARKGRILMRRLPRQNQAMYDSLSLLYGEPSGGELEFLAAMDEVTPDDVRAAAQRYMNPDNWVVAIAR
jgi:predicted Zn-dependent peptidase